MPLITTNKVTKVYTDNGVPVEALRGVDLEIKKGDFDALAGPSGSGKTTLLNIIGALDNATSGGVTFDNMDLVQMSESKRSKLRLQNIGFVFQAYNLIPVLTALENVEYVLLLRGVPQKERHEKSLKILNEVGLEGFAKRRPNEMSGGQQQRVALARAIVAEPKVVLADEPTANLDSATGKSVLELMLKLNQEKGTTFIFSTHEKMVMDFSKRLLLLEDGKIVEEIVK